MQFHKAKNRWRLSKQVGNSPLESLNKPDDCPPVTPCRPVPSPTLAGAGMVRVRSGFPHIEDNAKWIPDVAILSLPPPAQNRASISIV